MKDQSFGVIPVRRQDSQYLYLLVQHNAGHWAFPKGHAENGETDVQAARRELLEETGVSAVKLLEDVTLSETYFFKRNQQTVAKTVRYFLGLVQDTPVHIQAAEIQAYRWANFDEATRLITFSESRRVLSAAQEYLTQRLKQQDVRLLGEV
ncbi:MAG: NUDIX domain-containing protein [Chloroflexi bacterium]|nr:NUDIX domain-containing protein [Chloroflexota bacterium]MCL5274318.1 NUDIX domain-containing protein [Chloroflexota bacterium]